MVIPWVGFPLVALLKTGRAAFAGKIRRFSDAARSEAYAESKRPACLIGPTLKVLRLDEAMHPLTILATGLYGETLPPQDGAPIRFGRALEVRIQRYQVDCEDHVWSRMSRRRPGILSRPNEYGFYSNVNPNVSHPRWSQAKEHRIGEFGSRPTLLFNGYAEQVGVFIRRNGFESELLSRATR